MNNSGVLTHAVLDEISLEGLDGITIKSLWVRLSVRLNLPLPLNENFCNKIWSFLLKQKSLLYYELPEPRPIVKVFVRCDYVENDNENEEWPYTVYRFNPISIDKLRGSCQDFDVRTVIDWSFIHDMSLQEINDRFGDRLIIVASQQMRESAIFPETVPPPTDLTLFSYCILERIARARHNGEKTNGKFSMANLMDSSKSFYIRRTLCKYKLIMRQTYYEKVFDKTGGGSLLHLTRFYSEYKKKQMTLTEQIVEILKSEPNCMAEYSEIRKHFDVALHNSLKKLYKESLFQKFVMTDMQVPFRTIYPKAKTSEWKKVNLDAERELRVMQLRDPDIDVNDLWPRENIPDDNDDNQNITLDATNQLLDESLIKQAYHLIEKSGSTGVSASEIAKYFGMTKLNCRLILRNLERMKEIKKYYVDKGRQRFAVYITMSQQPNQINIADDETITAITTDTSNDNIENDTNKMDLSSKNGLNESVSSSVSECSEKDTSSIVDFESKLPDGWQLIDVTVKIELIEKLNRKSITESNMTARIAERLNIILKSVKKSLVISEINQLVTCVQTEEGKLGHVDMMCRKSIYRLLSKLCTEKRIKLWQISLTYEKHAKTSMFICDIAINEDHQIFRSLLEREKEKFLRRILNENVRKQEIAKQQLEDQNSRKTTKKKRSTNTDKRSKKKSTNGTNYAPKKKVKPLNSTDDDPMLNYGVTPKFIKMRTLHEFMFYLVYSEEKSTQIIKPLQAIEHWQTIEPLVDYDELVKKPLPAIYSKNLDWKTFVPPLILNPEFGDGWILMSDLIQRLPLSIFVKLINIKVEVPGLDEYLEHPIRKHFLLKYIPPAIQNELVKGRKHLFMIDETMRRLCCIGLLQIGPQWTKDKDQLFVYLNRRASLFDTISSEPGYYYVTKKDYPRLFYYFVVDENVHRYWQQLYQICSNTRLNRRSKYSADNDQMLLWNLQPVLIEHMTSRLPCDVEQYDTAEIPGDNLGAGGLDSSFFSHLLRNWSLTKYKIKSRSTGDNSSDENEDNNDVTPDPEKAPTENEVISYKRSVRQKKKKSVPISKRPARNMVILKRHKIKSQPKSVSRELIKKAAKKLRQPLYNDIDKMALRQMTKLRVDWSSEEDNMILFCKVAMLYLCPNPRKQGIPMCSVRDILQWLLKSNDKTSRACQRRIIYMMKNPVTASNVHMCLLEVQHNTEITQKFPADLYERLRDKFGNDDGFSRALRIVFVDFIVMLRKYFVTLTTTKLDETHKILLPDTVNEFKQMYVEHGEDYQNECIKYARPTKRTDVEVDVLSALIHSSVCCARDKTSWSVQLYDIYKDYPDRLLLMAMEKVRNYQMISAKKTVNQSRLKACENLPLSANPYHLSVTYQHQFMTSISYDIFYDIYLCMRDLFTSGSEQVIKFSNITPGRCIAFSQLVHNRNIQFDIEIPPKMLVIDKSFCEGGATALERTSSKFRQIFENIPNLASDHNQRTTSSSSSSSSSLVPSNANDVTSKIATTSDNSKKEKKRVMINTEHEKIEYHMSPVEKLMKLDDSMYHFFCLFRKFGLTFEFENIEIEIPGRYCSFDCVLRETEPILTMIDMIKLDDGDIMKQINIDEQEPGIHETMTIDINNILVIFSVIVGKIFNNDEPFDLEDISDYGVLKIALEILNDNTDNDLWFSSATKVDNDESNFHDEFIDGKMTRNILGSYSHESADKIHNYFYVRTCKILINHESSDNGNLSDEENRIRIHKLSAEKKSMVLKKTVSDAIWKKNSVDNEFISQTLSKENYTNNDIQSILYILKFIETKEDLGAENSELIAEFPDKTTLLKAVQILKDLNIIMRAGICEFVFIHWKYVTPWIISTYNIKRLEKESIEPTSYHLLKISDSAEKDTTVPSKTKRKRSIEDNLDENNEPTAKIAKSEENEPIPSTSRGATRFDKVTLQKNDLETSSRTTFTMRVNPWIRVNGGLNRRVLDKWLGSILAFCIANPGSMVFKICQRFNLQQPIHIRLLLEYLELLECIELQTITTNKPTLFSSRNSIIVQPATELDTMDKIFVNVKDDAVTKMSAFIGDKQYSMDFI